MITRIRALTLLSECDGYDIWSVEYCQSRRVPQAWIEELTDCFESGFRNYRQTIHHAGQVVNQYEGVRDVDLAYKLAEFLGLDSQRIAGLSLGPQAEVAALKEAIDE